MSAPTPQAPPQGNGICETTSRSDFDYYILHNQNIPATSCSESVIGSPFEQTVSNYLDGFTDLTYEFDDLEVIPTAKQQAINQLHQMLGGSAPATPSQSQDVDFVVPSDVVFPVDFQKKKFEEKLSLAISEDSAIDGLLNPYCWTNGKLQNNLVQYKDQLGRMYGPENISSYGSSMTSELRGKADDFKARQEQDWTDSLNPDSAFSANDSFEYNSERDGSSSSASYNFNVGSNFNVQVGYGEATVGTFVQGADKTVTKQLTNLQTTTNTIGSTNTTNGGGVVTTTTPGPFLPTQGSSETYSIRAAYRLNDNWAVTASYENSTFEWDGTAQEFTDNCDFLPKQSHNLEFGLHFTF